MIGGPSIAAGSCIIATGVRRSLTWDQGAEMALHARLKIDAGVQVYFCDPHSPWQRGTNENTNGLLRQYFPKRTDFSVHSAEEIAAVAATLNSRPRKRLDWQTPAEALDQLLLAGQPRLCCDNRLNPPITSPSNTPSAWEAGIEPSVGSVGDSYDNALAETINGLYKAEVIHRRGPWRSFEAVEFATLEWVDWFNNRRLLEPIGNMPPAEAEERYYAMLDQPAMVA
jgi:transposase InsO family protein